MAEYTGAMDSAYHHEGLRAELIEKGRGLLIREGYANFSLRQLAKEIGVSHAAPYRHFASREEFIAAIVREDQEEFNRALAAGIRGIVDPYERLYSLGEAYVFFFLDRPEVLLLFSLLPGQVELQGESLATIFSSLSARPGGGDADGAEGPGLKADTQGMAYPNLDGYELLRQAVKPFAERFRGLSDREIILGYWAKVHGLASLLASQKGFLAAEGLRERVSLLVRTPF